MRFKILFLSILISSPAFSHSGRTNSEGCHNNLKTGDYHCHGMGSVKKESLSNHEGDVLRKTNWKLTILDSKHELKTYVPRDEDFDVPLNGTGYECEFAKSLIDVNGDVTRSLRCISGDLAVSTAVNCSGTSSTIARLALYKKITKDGGTYFETTHLVSISCY